MLHYSYIGQCTCLLRYTCWSAPVVVDIVMHSWSFVAGSPAKRQLFIVSHLRELPQLQLKNAASLKALCSAQGSPHPNAHFYRGRSPDLSPNLGQCWRVTSSLELSIGSVEASIETASLYLYLYPNLLSPLSFLWGFQQHSSINFLHANLCLRDCVSRNLTYDRDDRASCQQVFLKWFRRKTKSLLYYIWNFSINLRLFQNLKSSTKLSWESTGRTGWRKA